MSDPKYTIIPGLGLTVLDLERIKSYCRVDEAGARAILAKASREEHNRILRNATYIANGLAAPPFTGSVS
jgi:hypothetical protein